MEEIVLKIIIHAGNAKSMLYEALDYAKENDFKKADELIENANEEILKAHKVQTELIQKEAGGDKSDISILLIHSQDHFIAADIMMTVATQYLGQAKRLHALEAKVNG